MQEMARDQTACDRVVKASHHPPSTRPGARSASPDVKGFADSAEKGFVGASETPAGAAVSAVTGPHDRGGSPATSAASGSLQGARPSSTVALEVNRENRDHKRLWRLYEASIDGIVVVDAAGSITGFNAAAQQIFGYRKAEAMGADMSTLLIPVEYRERHRAGFDALVRTGDSAILRQRVRVAGLRADGSTFAAELVIARIDETPLRFAAFIRDITEETNREDHLRQLATDNAQILESAGDGIYRVDLTGRITYANPAAAEILGFTSRELIGSQAHKLLHHSHEDGTPYARGHCPIVKTLTSGEVVHVTTEVFWRADGSSFPVDYTGAPIRDNNEIVGAVCVFADISEQKERERELRHKAAWTQRIHLALREDRFLLFGQPIFEADDPGEPAMHELLVRMQSREGAVFPPAEFLPQAARHGLITDIDRWVVREAMKIATARPVSVNLSAQALGQRGFAGWILDEIAGHAVHPGNLVFEITETAALEDVQMARRLVKRLTDLGCGVALDDFGIGYGTFAELRSLPVTHLKIDRQFVSGIASSDHDRQVVEAIIGVARKLGMKTVAEGVEDEAGLAILRELDVDYVQGFYLGRPGPLEPARAGAEAEPDRPNPDIARLT